MYKKTVLAFLSAGLCLCLSMAGCKNFVESGNSDLNQEYGSLLVKTGSADSIQASVRSLYLNEISYAVVSVSGTGISRPLSSDYVVCSGGASTGGVSILNIPVGKNRIVTVQGYDSEKKLVRGAVIRTVTDIGSGENSCVVTQSTTALGNVFNSLLEKSFNLENAENNVISLSIDSSKAWSLIDSEKIASDYMASSLSSDKSSYYVSTGTVEITAELNNAYSIQITDPSSKKITMSKTVSSKIVADAAPGTWSIMAFDSEGKVVARNNNLKVVSGEKTSVNVNESVGVIEDLTGKTIIFVKANSAPTIWAWEDNGAKLSELRGDSWITPTSAATLVPVTTAYMTDCSGWYMVDYSDIATGKPVKYKLNRKDPEITALAGCSWYTSGNTASSTNPSPASSNDEATVSITVTNPEIPGEDSITVHAKQAYIYYWTDTLAGVSYAMTDEGNGWYKYTIPLTSCSIIFKDDSEWTNKTSDLSRTEPGEYWYKSGKWYEANPDDDIAPVLSSFTADKSGSVSEEVTFTVTASDNLSLSKAILTLNETSSLAKIDLSGKSDTQTFVWNTALLQNGSYSVKCTVYDEAGNASETSSLSFTTSNENLPPVALINGAGRATINSEKTYTASSSYDQNGGSIVSYTWSVSGGASIKSGAGTDTIIVLMPSSETTVTISLVVKDNDGASSESVTKEVTVTDKVTTDFRDETIYFLMTTRFYDGDSSNNRYCWDDEACFKSETLGDPGWRGDFKGLIEKLDYIKALGFTAIWITPVVENASGLDYHGYHAFDFSKVDPRYESSGVTYQDLIDACHAKGIKVIQDIVLNHTGNFGERNLLNIMEKDYDADDGTHSVPAYANPDGKDIYGNSAYEKLTAGAKLQGFNTYEEIPSANGEAQYQARLMTMKNDSIDNDEDGRLYHHYGVFNWESYYVQEGQMAGDCVDLNTENPKVAEYLRNCYINYINMGVDAFRIDTMKHISRLTMNKEFIPYFEEAGGESFFMFGEGCVLRNEVFNDNHPGISVCFYTWNANKNKTDASYIWQKTASGAAANLEMAYTHFMDNDSVSVQPTSTNAFLNGLTYHTPDYSKASGLAMIDFYMHHGFKDSGAALSIGKTEDQYFNDSTYNVTYVDSHDYGPNEGGYLYTRYSGGEAGWADNFNLMFTFRGIPCVYYGSEIEFQKGKQIEPYTNGNKAPYAESGRAYYGDHLEGNVTASDFGVYTASGVVEETLNSNLSKHLRKLNKMRASVPALRRGQYTADGSYVSGGTAYIRRYTDSDVDSIACISVSGGATFKNLPAGKYIDICTGDVKNVSEGGSLTSSCSGQGNLRIYVNATKDPSITGKIGGDSPFIK